MQKFKELENCVFNSFNAKVALMHPKKIVQSQLTRRLEKAACELGLHYFQFHLAKIHKFTNIVNLFYSFLSQIKYKLSIVLNKKVVPNDNFKFGSERVKMAYPFKKHLKSAWFSSLHLVTVVTLSDSCDIK